MSKKITFEELLKDFNNGFFAGSQAKFARELGIAPQLVNSWVKGKNIPSRSNMEKISKIFKKDITEIQKIFSNSTQSFDKIDNNNFTLIMELLKEIRNSMESKIKHLETELELLKTKIDKNKN